MTRLEWRRPLLGAALGLTLTVFGPIGMAVGWLSNPVGLYSQPIPYRADVGVFAYSEGRVELGAVWLRDREDYGCWPDEDTGDEACGTMVVHDRLEIVAARGQAAVEDRNASVSGQVNPATRPEARSNGSDHAGETEYLQVHHSSCDEHDRCDYRDASLDWAWSRDLEIEVDPRLRWARLHAEIITYDEQSLTLDAAWTQDGPLRPSYDSEGPGIEIARSPRAAGRQHSEQSIGRRATATASLHGWAPDPVGTGTGRIYYAVTEHGTGDVVAPARAPCADPTAHPACEL